MHNPINKMNNLWFNYYQTLYYYRAKYWNRVSYLRDISR